MRFIITFILIIIATIAVQLYYPWWMMGVACFVVGGLVGMNGIKSFFAGFLAMLVLWGGYAWFLSSDSILPGKMAELFTQLESLGEYKVYGMIGFTSLIGAILAGLATLTGALGRNMFRTKQKVETA